MLRAFLTGLNEAIDRLFMLSADGRYRPIEGLRAVAAILVLGVHFFPPYEAVHYYSDSPLADPIVKTIRSGILGVDLFFVISGFLIWGALVRRQTSSFEFFTSRALRLLPTHFVVLSLFGIGGLGWAALALNFSFAGTFIRNFDLINNVTWSLGWEWLFYFLIFPCAAFVRTYPVERRIGLITICGGAFCSMLIVAAYVLGTDSVVVLPYGGRFASFFTGAIVADALLLESGNLRRFLSSAYTEAASISAFIALMAIFQFIASDPLSRNVYFLSVSLACSAIVAGLANGSWRTARILTFKPLRIIGQSSYSFYLIHVIVGINAAQNYMEPNSLASMIKCYLLSVLITSVCAAGFFVVTERPYFEIRKRAKLRTAIAAETA